MRCARSRRRQDCAASSCDELGETSYIDGKGRPKVVRYWRMRAVDGDFAPHDEVDEIRWETPQNAVGVLSWARDLPLLERL